MNRLRSIYGLSVFVLIATAGLPAAGTDTRLVDAAKRDDKEAVKGLLKQKVAVDAPYGDGTTPLHWAAYWDDVQLADLLIAAGGNVNARNDAGATPLWAAVSNGGTA